MILIENIFSALKTLIEGQRKKITMSKSWVYCAGFCDADHIV